MKKFLHEDISFFMNKIHNNDNFALLRYGDGERALMTGKRVIAQEGWSSPDKISELGIALESTLYNTDSNVYYGISCPCCDREAYYWYISRIKNPNITFANIFVNSNYKTFIQEFNKITRDAIVIANHRGKGQKIGNLNILDYFSVGDDCVNNWVTDVPSLLQNVKEKYGNKKNLLYVVSAGPLSEPIILDLYSNNSENCYIDFGSSIDSFIHGKDTRPYTNPNSVYGKRDCWMFDNSVSFDVSVVLTTYKKPEALKLQLDAIKQQNLQPKEILLYQDGIEGYYSITYQKDFLDCFSKVEISNTNNGVWKRFEFAQCASSKYICIFDDDTIPGNRWLENCHYHCVQNPGVYGTLGIVLEKSGKYPYKNFYKVGWINPNDFCARADFIGHSWFLESRNLSFLFDGTEEFRNLKYVAEDMCLSWKCKQKGIDTYVPPHPLGQDDLWGSNKQDAMSFGSHRGAVSLNPNNIELMYNAVSKCLKMGWAIFYKEDRASCMKQKRRLGVYRYKYFAYCFLKKAKRKISYLLKVIKK